MKTSTTLTDRKRTMIFLNIVISCIATSMLSTALTTALPSMITDLHISVTTGQWLTSGYSLAMGIMMPLTAFLIHRFPTRRLYLTGLLLSLAGLIFCVIAPGFPLIMTARIFQACGNGILTAMAQVIILSIYPPQKRGTAMGWYGLSIGAAPVIAPTLAGVIVDSIGWKAIFYISILIIFVSLLWGFFVLEDILDISKPRFDVPSFILSVFAFGGITLGMGNLGTLPLFSLPVAGALGIGLLTAVFFTFRQLRLTQPFLNIRILTNRTYALSVVGSAFLYFVMMGSTMLLPLYIQSTLGYSATVSGLVVLPGSAVMALISPFAGKLYDRVGMKTLFLSGSLGMLFSNLGMCFVNLSTGLWAAILLNMIRNFSIGCLLMSLVTWGTSDIQSAQIADGTALLTSLRTIAGAIGSALFVSLMHTSASRLSSGFGEATASMLGINIAFAAMSIVSLILVFIAVIAFGPSRKKGCNAD